MLWLGKVHDVVFGGGLSSGCCRLMACFEWPLKGTLPSFVHETTRPTAWLELGGG